jgi:hypothetical protein
MRSLVPLIHTLYDMRRTGGLTDAEARWILELVLREYGLTLADLAAWAAGDERAAKPSQ